jgi:hypothetical protein
MGTPALLIQGKAGTPNALFTLGRIPFDADSILKALRVSVLRLLVVTIRLPLQIVRNHHRAAVQQVQDITVLRLGRAGIHQVPQQLRALPRDEVKQSLSHVAGAELRREKFGRLAVQRKKGTVRAFSG